jgi:hypothetical protein
VRAFSYYKYNSKLKESFIQNIKDTKNKKKIIPNNRKNQSNKKCVSAIAITSSPIAKQAVAAGEGAFKT